MNTKSKQSIPNTITSNRYHVISNFSVMNKTWVLLSLKWCFSVLWTIRMSETLSYQLLFEKWDQRQLTYQKVWAFNCGYKVRRESVRVRESQWKSVGERCEVGLSVADRQSGESYQRCLLLSNAVFYYRLLLVHLSWFQI